MGGGFFINARNIIQFIYQPGMSAYILTTEEVDDIIQVTRAGPFSHRPEFLSE